MKGCSDHHFVLGISEKQAKIRTILCKGSRYPPLVPPPYVSLLDFEVPVLEGESEKGALHASLLSTKRQITLLGGLPEASGELEEAESSLQLTLIKLFAVSISILY